MHAEEWWEENTKILISIIKSLFLYVEKTLYG